MREQIKDQTLRFGSFLRAVQLSQCRQVLQRHQKKKGRAHRLSILGAFEAGGLHLSLAPISQ